MEAGRTGLAGKEWSQQKLLGAGSTGAAGKQAGLPQQWLRWLQGHWIEGVQCYGVRETAGGRCCG